MTEQAVETPAPEAQATEPQGEVTEPASGAALLDPTPKPDESVPAERPPWTEGLESDDIGLIEERQWKNVGDVFNSYRALEKLKGAPADQFIQLPAEDATEAELNEFFSRLGRPDDPKEYGLQDIDIPEGSIDLREQFGEWAHRAGLTPQQAKALAEAHTGFTAAALEEMEKEFAITSNADIADLKREWGQSFEPKRQAGVMAAREFGVTSEQMEQLERAWGTRAMVEFFSSIGEKMGEMPGPSGDRVVEDDPFVMSPERAQFEINKIRMDPELSKLYAEGNREIFQRMTRLQKLANPEPKE